MHILLVDDEPEVCDLVGGALAREGGFELTMAAGGAEALGAVGKGGVDLMVLDISLPDMNGLDVLRAVRRSGDLPVILLTGRSGEMDRVVGLELGADDYVIKPFSPRELVARVRTVLRRPRSSSEGSCLVFDGLVVDCSTREAALRDGVPVDLKAREFDLLAFLASSPRRVFTREQLLRDVWRSDVGWQSLATVTEHVHRLRAKLEVDPLYPRWIVTVKGVGYRFEP